MELRPFGWSELDVPVVGQGTWKLRDHRRAEETLKLGLGLGLAHIDTAEAYTGSEETVGRAIRDRRDDVFLVSKVTPKNASYEGTLRSCRRSLARLGTDHLDVYLLHWPSTHPIEDTMAAMAELIDAGRIRMAGVSNHDIEQMETAEEALGGHRIACNQVLYHPGRRDIELELIPHCKRRGVAVVGYSPFGSGSFPGGKEALDAAAAIGAEHDKSAYQVVLDALSRHENVFLIPKAEREEHVRDLAAALEPRLPLDAYEVFDELFPLPRPDQVAGVPTA